MLTINPDGGNVLLPQDGLMTLGGLFEAAGATVFGFFLFAALFPPIGYLLTKWIWRAAMGRRRKKRLKRGAIAREAAAAPSQATPS